MQSESGLLVAPARVYSEDIR